MGGCANITGVVVEDEVFEMDEFAVDPQRGAGTAKMDTFEKAAPTGERLMRSSRDTSAMPESDSRRSGLWKGNCAQVVTP